MSGLVVAGLVGRLGVASVDGRRIAPGGFRVGELPLPLMWLDGGGPSHDGARIAGRIAAVEARAGEVRIVGSTFPEAGIEPGTYGCGMDLRDCAMALLREETGESFTEADVAAVLDGGEWPDLLSVVESGELMAVTIYRPESTARPAWPGVEVTVGG